jgi:hypothetical protein
MIHKGVRYSVAPTVDPDIWQWQFEIGHQVKTGKTKTRLAAMAARRVRLKIDAALKECGTSASQRVDPPPSAPGKPAL